MTNKFNVLALVYVVKKLAKANRSIGSAPAFLTTRLETFEGRGQGGYLFRHNLGDVTGVVDGREAHRELQGYRGQTLLALLAIRAFMETFAGQCREPGTTAGAVEAKLRS